MFLITWYLVVEDNLEKADVLQELDSEGLYICMSRTTNDCSIVIEVVLSDSLWLQK